MTEREAFEAAMKPLPCAYDKRHRKYTDAGVQLAWFSWQASRRAALEELADVIGDHWPDRKFSLAEIEQGIRTLAASDRSEGK
jgi:hypothetical protein